MTFMYDGKKLTWLTVTLYWSSLLGSLTMPWVITIVHGVATRHMTLSAAWQDFRLHLFAPGYNLFLGGVLNAAPFVVLAIFLLLHLGTALPHGAVITARRTAGVLGAWLVAIGLSLWIHLSLTFHPDAQGAIALFLLPFYVLLLMPVGYGGGRLIGWLRTR